MSITSFIKDMPQITFYLVRHGEAENNVLHILNSAGAKTEYSLTEQGRAQAKRAAEYLATVGADALYSSPILRAKETAGIISEATRLPIVFDDRLWEVGMGRFNDASQGELLKKYPEPQMRLTPDTEDEMESMLEVHGRLGVFLREIKDKHSGQKVILVSHGDPLEQLHGILTHEGPGRAAEGWYPEKGSCTEVVWQY